MFSISAYCQSNISGTVVGRNDHMPIVGASVKVKGSALGTLTDNNGKFSITAKYGVVLQISYVGYNDTAVSIGNETSYNFELTPASNGLNEVVVTGYTAQRKVDIIGSVSIVNVTDAKQVPTASTEQLLQGQAPGVTVISPGSPGSSATVFIRGISSFGDTNPLYIIDGVPASIHDINPDDIESIQVLKDAGAASIYGVRGSNGVVIVTTKRGKKGRTTFSYDAFVTRQLPLSGNPFHLLNTPQLAELTYKVNPQTVLFPNGQIPDYLYQGNGSKGVANAGDPSVDPSKYNFDANNPSNDYLIAKANKQGTDWFHEIFKPSFSQSHTLSASGGNDNASFFSSFSYLDQQGTLIHTYDKRYAARLNGEITNAKKTFRIGANSYAFYKENPYYPNQDEGTAVGQAYREYPIIPVHDINGHYAGTWVGPSELGNSPNPVATLERTANDRSHTYDLIGNAYAELDFLKHFTARTSAGGTIDNNNNYQFNYNTYENGDTHNGANAYHENSYTNTSLTWTNTIRYSENFGNHSVKALGGLEIIENAGRALGGSASNYFTLDPAYVVLSTGTTNVSNYSNAYHNSLYSLFVKVDYSYKDKYLLGATLRSDASSKFATDKNTGYFPAGSIGWRISQESFLRNVKWINDLKVRGSYGVLGSQNNVSSTNAYTLFGSGFGSSFYAIDGTNSLTQGFNNTSLGNPNTTWEKDNVTNLGLDATLINNHIDFSVEYYKKSISGLLFPQPLPASAGLAQPPVVNIGNIENKGVDMMLTYHGNISKDFKFNIGLNVTTYKNTVTNIPGGYFDASYTRLGNVARNEEGHPVGAFYGYKVLGLFSSADDVTKSPTQDAAAPGRFKFADINGDGKITPADRTFIGNPNPDFTYGVNLNASYRSFDILMILYGSHGNQVFNYTKYFTDFLSTFTGAKSLNLLNNSWSPSNLNAKTPVPESSNNFSNSGVANSYYVEDGAFLKCRSLQLGYSFDPSLLKKAGLGKLRIYLQAVNLFSITKYSGLDPELAPSTINLSQNGNQSAAFGVDYGNYPNNQKSYILGVNLTF